MRHTIAHILSTGALIALIFGVVLTEAIGRLEGRNLPVAGPVTISEDDIIKEEDGWTYFSMSGPKLRDCQWEITEWFLGSRSEGFVPVPFEHLGRPQVRETGGHVWPLNRVRMPSADLIDNSFSDVDHDCGWFRWWLVHTPLFN